uniref:Uncharacterized protein n=1 Tax=Acrobeloides nanus TaxID=290746 RepID=A0A914EML2_9BILA
MAIRVITHSFSTPDVDEASSPGKKKICLVCASPTGASPHFGTISCLACAAFFRRTVSLDIKFKCTGSLQCKIYYELRMICRACRFDKCVAVGMKPECVQKRKPMKKYSIKRSTSPMEEDNTQPELPQHDSHINVDVYDSSVPSSSNSEFMSNSTISPHLSINSPIEYKVNDMIIPTPLHPTPNSANRTLLSLDGAALLRHFVSEEQKANNRRRVMFARSPIDSIIGTSDIIPYTKEDLVPYTVKGQQKHMRFDQMLAYEYIKALPGFEYLEPHDKLAIFRFGFMGFGALDIAYFTSKMGMVDQGIMVFTDATYSTNFDRSVGWDNEEDITADDKQKLVWPMNQKFWDRLIKPLDGIEVDHVEYAALKALTMWRTYNLGYLELSDTAKQLAREHENGIINGLMEYYQSRGDGAERVGTLILFIGNLFEIYQTLVEYYKKIELFNLIKIDLFLKQLLQF